MRSTSDPWTRRQILTTGAGALLAGPALASSRWQESQTASTTDEIALRQQAVELTAKAVDFLRSRQEPNGGWTTQGSPGITALALTGLLRSQRLQLADPVVTKALAYMDGFRNPSGGFDADIRTNYVTSIMLLAYNQANADGRYDALMAADQRFLKQLQWDQTEGKTPDDAFYGGAGYGSQSRPDLSNTAFFMEALRTSGLPADDPALQRALTFVSRTQNLDGEYNDQPWAGKVNDGGFAYSAANGGSSQAGTTANGGLRSYGSMTYAGFKSLIYAGLTQDDPRYQAALDFLRKNYSVEENPGMGQQGLFYYYQVMSKALSLLDEDQFTSADGTKHDWRAELLTALAQKQSQDGSWTNPADRWLEGNPDLVTSYALLTLASIRSALG